VGVECRRSHSSKIRILTIIRELGLCPDFSRSTAQYMRTCSHNFNICNVQDDRSTNSTIPEATEFAKTYAELKAFFFDFRCQTRGFFGFSPVCYASCTDVRTYVSGKRCQRLTVLYVQYQIQSCKVEFGSKFRWFSVF
jgi:hypothetical protein